MCLCYNVSFFVFLVYFSVCRAYFPVCRVYFSVCRAYFSVCMVYFSVFRVYFCFSVYTPVLWCLFRYVMKSAFQCYIVMSAFLKFFFMSGRYFPTFLAYME